MKPIRFLLLALCGCAAISCEKSSSGDNNDPAHILASTHWRATLTDENPATNPPGEFGDVNDVDYNNLKHHQYYPWQDCHMDDTFTFKNGRFNVDDNKTVCPDGMDLILGLANQPYVYDEASKKLTIGAGDDSATVQVYELNETRLKLGVALITASGLKHIIFLFKKK